MSGLVPLIMLWLASKGGGGSSAPKWPGRKHPPPKRMTRGLHNPSSPPSPAPPPPMDAASHATPLHEVGPVSKEILVADAQRIAIARGEALKPDGLYGPKTAAAWARIATAKGLAPDFARLGPRTASVDAATYQALSSGAMNPKSMAKAQAKRMLSSFGGKILSGVYIP